MLDIVIYGGLGTTLGVLIALLITVSVPREIISIEQKELIPLEKSFLLKNSDKYRARNYVVFYKEDQGIKMQRLADDGNLKIRGSSDNSGGSLKIYTERAKKHKWFSMFTLPITMTNYELSVPIAPVLYYEWRD